jgi:signal transduction histidine kinase
LFSVLIALWFARGLVRPIRILQEGAQKVGAGELDQKIEVNTGDELESLANQFNNMTERLRESYSSMERKVDERTAELLIARDAADAANQAKSMFLASASHELRTPLNAIIGYSEMLTEEAGDLGQQSFVPDLQKIRASGMHLLALINDILDLAKIEAGKIELIPETIDIAALIEEVTSMVQPLIEKNANVLSISRPDDLGAMYADITKVRQILFNLLSNACKFTELGTITLDVAREKVEGSEKLSLSVRDTGIGMTGEQMAKLFQPFSQADIQTARKYGGTGLGLAITRQFCEMMGGEIKVNSEFGRGTTFTVMLPMAKEST